MGFLSQPFGALADKIGARRLLIVGPLGAGFALLLLALGKNASLTLGVLAPILLLGISFALVVAPLTASVMSSVANSDEGLASGINNAMSRVQSRRHCFLGRHRVICIRLQSGIDRCRNLRRCRRCDHCSHAAGTGAPALDRDRRRNWCDVLRLILRERLHGAGIDKFNTAFAARNQFFAAQPLHHAIEMGNAQAEYVGHHFLRKWQGETRFLGTTDRIEPFVKFEQKCDSRSIGVRRPTSMMCSA